MASVAITEVTTERIPIRVVDLRPKSRNEPLKSPEPRSTQGVSIAQHHPDFTELIGQSPSASLLLSSAESSRNPFFHEAAVYLPEHDELYVTSNLLQQTSSSMLPVVLISKIRLQRSKDSNGDVTAVEWFKLRCPSNLVMPAGGRRFDAGMLLCAQGSLSDPGGLYYMPRGKPPVPLVTSYHGREFNSPHDVAVSPSDGALWFTDPCHGFEQNFRKKPQMPCQVFRLAGRDSADLRVVADGLGRPTSLAFSPDGDTLYVTDTDAVHGDGNQDATRPATIYAFDVIQRGGSPFLANKRVFAFALRGIPLGVKCDSKGNVYAGCADGLEVWSVGGTLLGVIEVQGGVSNFCFSRDGELFLCSETKLYRVRLGVEGDLMNFI